MGKMTLTELKADETGERLNLEASLKWILNEMKYEDFVKLTKLDFCTLSYPFHYEYHIMKEYDTPKSREEYLKYYMYKLYQNLETPDVELV